MTENEMAKMICYLADRVEKLEKERCKCNDNKPGAKPPELSADSPDTTSPTVTYVTNYDEDDECLTCSA